jgi:hypothetical protein
VIVHPAIIWTLAGLCYVGLILLAICLCKAAAKPMPHPPNLHLSASAGGPRHIQIHDLPPEADPNDQLRLATATRNSPTYPTETGSIK